MKLNKENKFVSLVVYLRNDRDKIDFFMDKVLNECSRMFVNFEVICVDDASTDGSVEALREYFERSKRDFIVNLVHMSYFQGLEAAMNAGRDLAIGDFVYEFDDVNVDYPAELLERVYRKLLEGYDIVAARSSGRQRLTSRAFYYLYNRTSHAKNKIGPETFRLLSRRAINRVKSMGQYIPYRKAIYMNCGLRAETVRYESSNVKTRVTNRTDRVERTALAMDSFIYFTDVLEKISLMISMVFLVITVGVAFYIVFSVFSINRPVEGWLSTMGFLAFGFLGMFALLTIILKYLSVMLNLIFKHQRYLVEGVEKLSQK